MGGDAKDTSECACCDSRGGLGTSLVCVCRSAMVTPDPEKLATVVAEGCVPGSGVITVSSRDPAAVSIIVWPSDLYADAVPAFGDGGVVTRIASAGLYCV